MGVNMEVSHERAITKSSRVLQAFFVIFIIAVIAVLAINIANKTNGVLIVEDENNEACWTSSKDIINKNNQVKSVKCKESAQKQSTTKQTKKTEAKKADTKKTVIKK